MTNVLANIGVALRQRAWLIDSRLSKVLEDRGFPGSSQPTTRVATSPRVSSVFVASGGAS